MDKVQITAIIGNPGYSTEQNGDAHASQGACGAAYLHDLLPRP